MNNQFNLVNKTILVTGASSGIGHATAIACSEMGASVILTGRNKKRLEECNDICKKVSGKTCINIPCDLLNYEEIKELVAQIPSLNGVVLNAGITKVIPVKFIKKDDVDDVFSVNTQAQILLLNELLRQKKLCEGASVVFTASMSALGETAIGASLYAASKSAICTFSKNAALELSAKHIRCNTICPGTVETNLTESLQSLMTNKDSGVKKYPLGRYGKPEDIANAFVFLLSDAASWITGIDLIVDGGLHINS